MKILINGKDGFIATHLFHYLQNCGYDIIVTSHSQLNALYADDIKRFFDNNEVDVVIHTVAKGGRRIRNEQNDDCYNTLLMFENMITYAKCKKFINFASGAEFDRSKDINEAKEEDIFNVIPTDQYGLAKNIISRRMIEISHCKTINLRLFNCFGPDEAWHRLVRQAITSAIENRPIKIVNKYMDFFFIEDFCNIVEWCLSTTLTYPCDINCVYNEKYTILDIVKMIQEITQTNNEIIIEHNKEFNYTGNGTILKSLPINLHGLNQGLIKTYNFISKQIKI